MSSENLLCKSLCKAHKFTDISFIPFRAPHKSKMFFVGSVKIIWRSEQFVQNRFLDYEILVYDMTNNLFVSTADVCSFWEQKYSMPDLLTVHCYGARYTEMSKQKAVTLCEYLHTTRTDMCKHRSTDPHLVNTRARIAEILLWLTG